MGHTFASVDDFFAQLATSDEVKLALAQARDMYQNHKIPRNTFVKRLMEMAGLEPDVLRAMYASRKEEAEKGGNLGGGRRGGEREDGERSEGS